MAEVKAFKFLIFLAILGAVSSSEDVDLETWEGPPELVKLFPYYLSGFDYEDRPIWIFEFGKYPFNVVVENGTEVMNIFETGMDQMHYRLEASREYRNSSHVCFLVDFDQIKFINFASFRTIAFLERLAKKYSLDAIRYMVVVNVNSVTNTFLNIFRTRLPHLFKYMHIFSDDRDDWLPKILEYFPKDQIPEWYGGPKDFVPFKVYG